MHDTSLSIGTKFLANYLSAGDTVVEIGSMDVNGSLRGHCPEGVFYFGIDIEHGKSVDMIVQEGAPLPLREGFCDALISSSQLEHDYNFWKTFLEFCRVTKKGGFIYINAPSNGNFHSYPIDAWRFYPDAGRSLVKWAAASGTTLTLVESFTAIRQKDVWNDFVAVFMVGECEKGREFKFLSNEIECYNVYRFGEEGIIRKQGKTEDQMIISAQLKKIETLEKELAECRAKLKVSN